MAWKDLSKQERMAMLGGGVALGAVVGFGIWTSRKSSQVANVGYELPKQDRDRLKRAIECTNDLMIRAAALQGVRAAKRAGYDVPDGSLEAATKNLYRHLELEPPDAPCVGTRVTA
jgi:hypothetical protein